jgi:hypothetical protein
MFPSPHARIPRIIIGDALGAGYPPRDDIGWLQPEHRIAPMFEANPNRA